MKKRRKLGIYGKRMVKLHLRHVRLDTIVKCKQFTKTQATTGQLERTHGNTTSRIDSEAVEKKFKPECIRCKKLHKPLGCPESLMSNNLKKREPRLKKKTTKTVKLLAMPATNDRLECACKERTGEIASEVNNSNCQQKTRHRRSRENGFRSAQQAKPPPPEQLYLHGFGNLDNQSPFSLSRLTNANERKPRSRRNAAMQSSHKPCISSGLLPPPPPRVRLPNSKHMENLNNLLRPFSYGSDEHYVEVPNPTKEKIPREQKPQVKKVHEKASTVAKKCDRCDGKNEVPRVPKGKLWIFESRRRYDERGYLISSEETASEVILEGNVIIFFDFDDGEL